MRGRAHRAGVLVHRLTGEVGLSRRDELAFDEPLTQIRAVVVDLSQVRLFCASGFNAPLRLRMRAEASGATVHLAGVRRSAARVFALSDAGWLFPTHPDLGAALAALARQEPEVPKQAA